MATGSGLDSAPARRDSTVVLNRHIYYYDVFVALRLDVMHLYVVQLSFAYY